MQAIEVDSHIRTERTRRDEKLMTHVIHTTPNFLQRIASRETYKIVNDQR